MRLECYSISPPPSTNYSSYISRSSIVSGAANKICTNASGGFVSQYSIPVNYGNILGGCNNYIAGSLNNFGGGNNIFSTVQGIDSYICGSGYYHSIFGCYNRGANLPYRGAGGAGCCVDLRNNWTFFTSIVKNSSTFNIKHPDPAKKETHRLVHTTVESPTAGDNMYRYQVTTINNKATIELPDYFRFLNKNEQVWITPKNHHGSAYGKVAADKKSVEITSDVDGDYQVLIFATRKDAVALQGWRGVEMISKGVTQLM